MCTKIRIVLAAIFLFGGFSIEAKVDSVDLLLEFFGGCVREDGGFGTAKQFEYCGCVTGQISEEMTTEELLSFGLEAIGKTETELQQSLIANDKLKAMVITCGAKLFK